MVASPVLDTLHYHGNSRSLEPDMNPIIYTITPEDLGLVMILSFLIGGFICAVLIAGWYEIRYKRGFSWQRHLDINLRRYT